jgi:hypothetical protein
VSETPLPDRGEGDEEAFTAEEAGILNLCNIGEEAFLRVGEAILHISPAEFFKKEMNQQHWDMWALVKDLYMSLYVAHGGKYFALYTKDYLPLAHGCRW